ncbi:class C sortase [Enemella evansiae]|uniref:class C sortase n=1 Tax=Enemella evansiae TaxID=2016499 RepID=UPI000B967729|nr:class C sortase [Enemella evansiae]OYO06811.1 class C sortase [Enemella evansiae]OYO19747.1 class C sortase [Enemella evansiae]TDO91621.1 sortase A [Enemella evansiae]
MQKAFSRLAELLRRCVVLGLLLAGAFSVGQPVAEAVANDRATQQAATTYAESVRSLPAEQLSADLTAARAYNAALSPRALTDPWGATVGADTAHRTYLDTLPGPAMGRLRIPAIAVDMPIRHDADEVSLAAGVGHMYGSSLPVGGPDTHAVLAAHSGMRSQTFFDRLPELQPGERFTIEVAGTTLTYQVDQIRVVEPTELEAVGRVPGQDLVTLVTCYTPPGGHRERMLVRAVRVTDPAPVDTETVQATATTRTAASMLGLPPVQDWMRPRLWISGGALTVAALMLFGWLITDIRRAHRLRNKENSR